METDQIIVNVSKPQKKALIQRAAQQTAITGERMTMSDLVRTAIDQILIAPVDVESDDKSNSIKFTPLPPVARAIRQAHINSGRPVGEVVNQMLAEALHAEGVNL